MSSVLQSLPGFTSALTLSLCSDIASEHFESGTELVLSALLERAFSLPELVKEVRKRATAPLHLTLYLSRHKTQVSGGLVQEALMVLVQHGLVYMESVSGSFLYQANLTAVLERLRLPLVAALIKRTISSEVAFTFQEVARHGRIRRSEIATDGVDELLRLGFLTGGRAASRSRKTPAAKRGQGQGQGAAAKLGRPTKQRRRNPKDDAEMAAMDLGVSLAVLEQEAFDVQLALNTFPGGSGQNSGGGGGVLSVDQGSVRVKLLLEAAVEIMSSRYGGESGRMLRCICDRSLSLADGTGGLRSDWFNVETALVWLQMEGRTKEDQVTRILTMWTKTCSDFVRPWIGTRRMAEDGVQYRVDCTAMCTTVVEDIVCQVMLYRHGQSGLRIYNCLRGQGATDVAAVSETCLIDREETQSLLAKLVADGFLLVGSTPTSTTSSHSIWVYGLEGQKVVNATLAVLERTTLNLRRRLRAEVFLQTSMEDRAVTFTDEERMYLEKVMAAQDVLEAKLVQVGSTVALLRHALSLL